MDTEMGIPPTINAATLGMWDTMIVMIMALVVFGPRRLPKIGRQIGKLMYEFRKASNDFRFQMEEEMRNAEEADRRQREEAERQRALPAETTQPAQIDSSAVTEQSAANAVEQPEDYATSGDEDYRSSHDETASEDYLHGAPEAENEPGKEPQPARLSVKPPASGAPVAAERPTSRASAAPAGVPESPELPPSGDEAAPGDARDMSAEIATPQNLPASEVDAETEPAAHHG